MAAILKRLLKITSPYGERIHPIHNTVRFHNGIDIRADHDNLFCPEPGTIQKVIDDRAGKNLNGLALRIDHGDFVTAFVHLSEIFVIKGEAIKEGQIIGRTGNTGGSTGPHLHFGIQLGSGEWIDPEPYVRDKWLVRQATTYTGLMLALVGAVIVLGR